VTHQIAQVFDIVDKAAFLHEGTFRVIGTPGEIMTSKDPVVQQFIHGSIHGPIRY
jgi:phospholipid/cholesterol/gamma-HCH transport system ATP-binding protein